MKILLTGGGTGGHVLPNISLVPYLRDANFEVSYMGAKNSIEERLALGQGLNFYAVTCTALRRDKLLSNLKIPYLLMKGIREAKKILRSENIDVVFSKGGYVSLPACLAAKSLKIPVITHESDRSLGLANKIISRFAKLVIVKDDSIRCKAPLKVLQCPIRDSIFRGNKANILKDFKCNNTKPFLLILGGSSGAKILNNFVYDNIDKLTSMYNVLHIRGKNSESISCKDYYSVSYTDTIEDYYDLADIVISRAGAGVTDELLALNKKMILVPLENKASRGDQVDNAEYLASHNEAILLHEKDLNMDNMMNALSEVDAIKISCYSYDKATPKHIVDAIIDAIR